jgi:hypothetical protein
MVRRQKSKGACTPWHPLRCTQSCCRRSSHMEKFPWLEGENNTQHDEVEYGWVVLPHQTSMTDRCMPPSTSPHTHGTRHTAHGRQRARPVPGPWRPVQSARDRRHDGTSFTVATGNATKDTLDSSRTLRVIVCYQPQPAAAPCTHRHRRERENI